MSGTILFGDDGSEAADLAWAWLSAQDWDAWAIDVLTADRLNAGVASDEIKEWTPPHPRVLIDPTAAGPVRHQRTSGDPRVAIALSADHDIIVIGPRGRGVLKALHLGSTAEWLAHDPPAPLIIARHSHPVRTAVVCSDGSRDSLAAARVLGELPWVSRVDVTVISVAESNFDAEHAVRSAGAELEGRAKSVRHIILRPKREAFYHVRDIILNFLDEHDIDLVVHGTIGVSAWQSLRAGSIATSLAAHAKSTSLIVHERPQGD